MNHKQISKRNMYGKLLLFFVAKATSWSTFTRLVNEIALFVTKVAAFDKYVNQQQLEIKGITTDKDNKFDVMIALAVRYSRKARVWAVDTSNAVLEEVFNIHVSDFNRLPEKQAVAKIKDVRDALNANITSLANYNVIAANVTAISSSITAYEAVANAQGAAKSQTKTGTDGIGNEMKTIDASIEIIDDLLINEFQLSNADLVDEYLNNRVIDNIATHSSGIALTFVDAVTHAELSGVEVSIDGTNKTAVSDIKGRAEITSVKAGTYNVIISLSGYKTLTIKMDITKGDVLGMSVMLIPISNI